MGRLRWVDVPALTTLCERVVELAPGMQPREVAGIVSSLASLGALKFGHAGALHALATRCVAQLQQLNTMDVSMAAIGFARLGAVTALDKLQPRIAALAPMFDVTQVSTIAFALTKSAACDAAMLDALARRILALVDLLKPRDLVTIMHCCLLLNWRHASLLSALGRHGMFLMHTLTPRDLATFVHAMAHLNHVDKAVLDAVSRRLRHFGQRVPGALAADMVRSFGRFNYSPEGLAVALTPSVARYVGSANHDRIAKAFWGCTRLLEPHRGQSRVAEAALRLLQAAATTTLETVKLMPVQQLAVTAWSCGQLATLADAAVLATIVSSAGSAAPSAASHTPTSSSRRSSSAHTSGAGVAGSQGSGADGDDMGDGDGDDVGEGEDEEVDDRGGIRIDELLAGDAALVVTDADRLAARRSVPMPAVSHHPDAILRHLVVLQDAFLARYAALSAADGHGSITERQRGLVKLGLANLRRRIKALSD